MTDLLQRERLALLPPVDAEGWCTGCSHPPDRKTGRCLCVSGKVKVIERGAIGRRDRHDQWMQHGPTHVRILLARLDAAEARERTLRDAVDLAYRWVDFTPEGVDGLRSRMRRALAEALAREAQGYPSEWAYSAERIRRYLREAGVHLVTAEAEAVARVLRELADEVAEIHDDYNKTGESGWIGRSDVIGLIAAKAEAEGVKL